MNQKKIYDYYSIFGLSRAMSTSDIKRQMRTYMEENRKQRVGVNRNNTEILEKLNADQDIIRNAQMALCYDEARKKYDKQLDSMPDASIIVKIDTNLNILDKEYELSSTDVNNAVTTVAVTDADKIKFVDKQKQSSQDELEDIIRNLVKETKQYFYNKEYHNCIAKAKDLFEYNIAYPFTITAKAYFMLGEYETSIDILAKGCRAFANNPNLRWLYIRYLIQMERYNEAQQILNEAKRDFREDSLFDAEQVYLYLFAERDDLAIDEIKRYITNRPDDLKYREYLANNIIDISDLCYAYDLEAEMNIIADEYNYERCFNLLSIANQLYQNKTTVEKYENIKAFGVKYPDKSTIVWQVVYGIVAIVSLWAVFSGAYPMIILTILFSVFIVVIRKYSLRALWQIYRDKYRGIAEYEDNILYMIAMIPRDFVKSLIVR